MKIFELNNGELQISAEAYMLKPFKTLYDRDKSKDRGRAFMELAYVFFMCDRKSDYMVYTEQNDRSAAVMAGLGCPPKWKPDKAVQEAMDFYQSHKTLSQIALEREMVSLDKISKFVASVDYDAMEDLSEAAKVAASVANTNDKIPKLAKTVREMQAIVEDEENEAQARGNFNKSVLD